MRIGQVQSSFNSSFKGAVVNINAFSDTHGELILSNNALEDLRTRQQDIFCREDKGRHNILAICGDWFMDGGRTGYATHPEKSNAEFQLEMFNKFISEVNKIARNTTTLFSIGNHEFDGGVSKLDDVLSKIDADVIATNLDIENSPAFEKTIQNGKLFSERIIEVDDDKDPNLKHKLLFLAVMPVNLPAYQKKLDGIKLTDSIEKMQRYVTKEDYAKTLKQCCEKISEFKKENPNGIVIFMSHTGVDFADNLAATSEVDIIFDGHEHKEALRFVNATPIIPLSQNFKKIANTKLTIRDDGSLDSIRLKDFNPTTNLRRGPLFKFYCQLFKQDIRKTYSIQSPIERLDILDTKGIREGNNFLANFITDSVLEELQKTDPSIDIFALNASAIRHPLKVSSRPSIAPFDIMNVLAGIKEEDGKIMTIQVTGNELAYLVADNILFNKEMPQKNPIIHYSGLIIDKTKMLKGLSIGKKPHELTQLIIDARTNLPIIGNKEYKIANVEKYFNKSANPRIQALKCYSEYTPFTVQELFKKHFQEAENGRVNAKCDIRIK